MGTPPSHSRGKRSRRGGSSMVLAIPVGAGLMRVLVLMRVWVAPLYTD